MKKLRIATVVATLFASPAWCATGLDLTGMDKNVRPQDDLFRAMNGHWIATTEIPADKASFGITYQLRDRSDEQVKTLVEELAARKPTTGVERQIAAFHASYMDVDAIDRAGDAPLRPWLAQVDAIANAGDLSRLQGRMLGRFNVPVYLAVGPDDKNAGQYVPLTWQAGLGMPDRDYYLKDDARFAGFRDAYRKYLETLLRLAGRPDPAAEAKAVFDFEMKLARVHWDKVDNRDPQKTYNAMTAKALAEAAPGIDWAAYFAAAGLTWTDRIVVSQPSMVIGTARMMREEPLAAWQSYLRVRMIDSVADVLPKAYREASFAFHQKTLLGLKEPKPRWQLAAGALGNALGEAVGQVYVGKHFPPQAKARMQALVDNLVAAFRTSIDGLQWMSPETRTRAHAKLAKYKSKIGYPDRWRDYAALEVREGDALGNALRAGRFEYDRKTRRAGGPIDRHEWELTPQTVNAYYHPNYNEIVFPAAILQAPLFDMAADDAANYGAIGAVIGHEISHGFDDQGSQFDGDGNLNNWWTDADRKAFEALSERLVRQYEGYEPLPGHRINGKLTLGENIADLSGLQIAYKAYKLSLGGKSAPVVDGLTGEQRFFLSWSQAWRSKIRDEALIQRIVADPHSPAPYRANGAAVNADGFHEAFGTKAGDGMYRAISDRIRIW